MKKFINLISLLFLSLFLSFGVGAFEIQDPNGVLPELESRVEPSSFAEFFTCANPPSMKSFTSGCTMVCSEVGETCWVNCPPVAAERQGWHWQAFQCGGPQITLQSSFGYLTVSETEHRRHRGLWLLQFFNSLGAYVQPIDRIVIDHFRLFQYSEIVDNEWEDRNGLYVLFTVYPINVGIGFDFGVMIDPKLKGAEQIVFMTLPGATNYYFKRKGVVSDPPRL